MASKRDQLHAYQFLVQRTVSALVTRETDPEQPPFRRPGNAVFAGIAMAVIALAAVGVYGIIVPGGNDSWRDGQSVVVEKETGTRYVYLSGRLHPVANHTSALLAINRNAGTVTVSRRSLVGVPRGPRIGIPDAPDALPGSGELLGGGWTLCSQPGPDATGAVLPRSVLLVGQLPVAGLRMAARAILVTVQEIGETYLVHEGFRHRIAAADTSTVIAALRPGPALRIGPAVVESLPLGQPLGPIPVPTAGAPSTAIPGRSDLLVGQLQVTATSRGVQHYLVEPARLRPISELQYDIQRAYPPTAAAYPGTRPMGVPLELADTGRATLAGAEPPRSADPPAERPEFAAGAADSPICLTFASGSSVPEVTIGPAMPALDPMSATPRRTPAGVALADLVAVPPGQAALVESMPSPTAPAGARMIITDLGVAFPIAGPEVQDILGYQGISPVRVPAGVVSRIPMGPALSHAAAMSR